MTGASSHGEAVVGDPRRDLGAVAPRDRILVQHDHAIRLLHRLVHRLLVPRATATAGRSPRPTMPALGSWFAAANARCTVAPYVTIVTSVPSRTTFALPNGIMKFGPGIRRLVVRLAVEVLVLEEDHRIVAADRGAQQAVGVERGRRTDDAQARGSA